MYIAHMYNVHSAQLAHLTIIVQWQSEDDQVDCTSLPKRIKLAVLFIQNNMKSVLN